MTELVNQAEIHEKSLSPDPTKREEAAKQIGWKNHMLADKNQAWSDLIRLANDTVVEVCAWASNELGSIFIEVPDKDRAWTDLHALRSNKNTEVRRGVGTALGKGFAYIPDRFKHEAWGDLHELIYDKISEVRCWAVNALLPAYPYILDADKPEAWSDLHRCTTDMDLEVKKEATQVLGYVFSHIANTSEAWSDLHRLTGDDNNDIKRASAVALGKAFPYLPDKNEPWSDLHRLTQDRDSGVRRWAVWSVGLAYPYILEKHRSEARYDIHRLTEDNNGDVRENAATAISLIVDHIPDKIEAVSDLHRLSCDEYRKVRKGAAGAFESAFIHFPDKDQAWTDLDRLINDENPDVRRSAVAALGKVFPFIPDTSKNEALAGLHQMVKDGDSYVRMYTYYSLGRISVLKATEMDNYDALKKELETAVSYFEKSTQEDLFGGPAKFCHLFYRTYFAIIFQEAKDSEIQRYIAEAKEAVGKSESKDELIKAIENLAMALQKSQNLKDLSVQKISSELNVYRVYCEKAADQMALAEVKAPGAVKLLRKCNPIIEEKIQATIAKIQEKAKQICQITRGSGTAYEAPGTELQEAAKGLSSGDASSIQKYSERIVWQLKKLCRLLPAEDKEKVCEIVDEIGHEPEFPEKLNKIMEALLCLGPILEDKAPSLVDVVILTVLPEEYRSIRNRLSELGPPDLGSMPNLYAWKLGNVFCDNFNSNYKIVVGMIGRAGTTESALAAREAGQLWRPRYVLFSGIAGGLPDPKAEDARPWLGDVVIADVIYGYEYGKIDKKFRPRTNWTYRTDQALLNGARANALSESWRDHIKAVPPEKCTPEVVRGEIASGDQVVDDPTNDFFAQVLETWPNINAVEMEGAGAAAAIEQANSLGISSRFMMIRGISDLPRAEGKGKGRWERDAWKVYASDAAAAFTVGWIADGLPLPPSARN